jgi:hypothetical protein
MLEKCLLEIVLIFILMIFFVCFGRLNEYNTSLKSLKERRDSLYSKLSEVLVRKV